jgi:outer membrane protein TolC
MRLPLLSILGLALALAGAAGAADDPTTPPLTLEQALAAARSANAALPVADFDTRIAEQRRREAEAARRLQVRLEGDLWVAPAPGYDPVITNLGEDRLLVVAEKTLADGGALRAGADQARAALEASRARFRLAELDLDLEVTQQYAEILAAEREIEARREGLARLESYLALLEERARSGQPVAPDLLRTRVRLATDRAALVAAEGAADEARAGLNSAMGRAPSAPLEVVPLPEPGALRPPAADAWRATPEIAAAEREVEAAAAASRAAEAQLRPQVTARVDAGLWGSDTTRWVPGDYAASHPGASFGDRLRRDLGSSFTFGFSLPIFDSGVFAARVAESRLALEQARQRVAAENAGAALRLARAERALERAYGQYQLLVAAEPQARDAYLEAESRYRGGTASYLEVLDAFSASVDTAVAAAQAELAYRTARALVVRWGGQP